MEQQTKKKNPIAAWLSRIFIDGLSGMALGLFSTLIVGTILEQIGSLLPEAVGSYIVLIAGMCKALTGAGIGVGVAYKLKETPLVTLSCAAVGMIGAFASKLLAGTAWTPGVVTLAGPGEPLGAFIAAVVAIECGRLIAGKTKLDILLVPLCSILPGAAAGLILGPPISNLMTALGALINWGTMQQPILMGIIVAVIMGICLTLPISSAALCVILGLEGIAAGAAVVGCSAHMVGFAVASYRENKFGGLIAQGVGTSMLQMPNLVRKPILWLPPVITSAILGPISTKVLGMVCGPSGAGMGTSGLVGQIVSYQAMTTAGFFPAVTLIEILIMHVIAPAILTLLISEFMRKKGWIKYGDLKLDV
ncbi:MAG: PTS sugar transporter subunit IIC [Clostridia bacterium]|nr:PTS sugar transporter subunit IIC [Clostridia bacterium]